MLVFMLSLGANLLAESISLKNNGCYRKHATSLHLLRVIGSVQMLGVYL